MIATLITGIVSMVVFIALAAYKPGRSIFS